MSDTLGRLDHHPIDFGQFRSKSHPALDPVRGDILRDADVQPAYTPRQLINRKKNCDRILRAYAKQK